MRVVTSLILAVLVICFADLASSAESKCPRTDPMAYSVLYRHPADCSKYYECSNGAAILMNCPPGLHFNSRLNVCDWPQNANCKIGCEQLTNGPTGTWTPSPCSGDVNEVGASCSLQCLGKNILKGSAFITCTEDGWSSSNGNVIPKCVPEVCVVETITETLNKTLSVPASLLFVLDESGSVGITNFDVSKKFIKEIVHKYPLSATRSAGVITFDSAARVQVPLQVNNNNDFDLKVDAVQYGGGGTNILGALEMAYNEIQTNAVHPLTLVFLVTDGESQTDGTPAADKIKAVNQPIFAIGIGSRRIVDLEKIASERENHEKNFFHLLDYSVLESIGEYLEATTSVTGSKNVTTCS